MKSLLSIASFTLALASPVWAHGDDHSHSHAPASAHTHAQVHNHAPKLDAHAREDIERHRGMARAHEQAAQCLEQGNKYEDCQKQLQTSCKGLALGKNCGMRHSH